MKAIAHFDKLEKGILQLLKAADLYNLHLVALARNEEPSKELIQRIITTSTISGFAVCGGFYSESEREDFEKKEYLRAIGDQIMLATYVALEFYLIEKFYEYVRWKGKDREPEIIARARFMRRSLNDIRQCYRDILGIHLSQFQLDGSWMLPDPSFQPPSTWQRIKEVEKARHEVAHLGKANSFNNRLLSDPWRAFDFVRRWVFAFDANFDLLIFEGQPTPMIEDYRRRVAHECSCS